VAAVRASRGTSRLFPVGAATATYTRYLTEPLTGLKRSPWSAELLVYWPRLKPPTMKPTHSSIETCRAAVLKTAVKLCLGERMGAALPAT
jgi:hypothetical protein